jgi:hypothetical protein
LGLSIQAGGSTIPSCFNRASGDIPGGQAPALIAHTHWTAATFA